MVTTLNLKYAQRLRALRLSKDIKQKYAAELLGLPNQQSYSKLENGSLIFTEELILRICSAFDVSVSTFRNGECSSDGIQCQEQGKQVLFKPHFEDLLASKDELIESQKEVIQLYSKLLSDKEAVIIKLKRRSP